MFSLILFSVLPRKYISVITRFARQWRNRVFSFVLSSRWLNRWTAKSGKWKKRRNKEKRTWRSSVTQGYTLNVHIDAIALNSCSNGSLSSSSSTNRSTFYSQKNNLFPFDSFYLMLIPRWLHRLLFFSCASLSLPLALIFIQSTVQIHICERIHTKK